MGSYSSYVLAHHHMQILICACVVHVYVLNILLRTSYESTKNAAHSKSSFFFSHTLLSTKGLEVTNFLNGYVRHCPIQPTCSMPTKLATIFIFFRNRCIHLPHLQSQGESPSLVSSHIHVGASCCHAIAVEVQMSTRICVGANELRTTKSHQNNQLSHHYPIRSAHLPN